MSTPLLKTKLHIPAPLSNFVNRRDQYSRLDAGLDRQLTLVAAPAGFGKTTLISNWVRGVGQPVAWVSLDEADNDPALFWAYVISGFQSANLDGDGGFWGEINISQLPPVKGLLAQMINALAEYDQKIVLVLDDYHVISHPQIHKDLTYLVDNQPPSLHIILLTRADPPLPIPRLRGRGQLTEIRAADLRFTIEETTIFLNQMMRLDLNDNDIAALDQRAEGWIIGLQLAALSMQDRPDKHNFIADFSGGHHFILDFLTEEVIDHLPESQRLFLLQTSVLDHFNAALCNHVVGVENSTVQLEKLQHQNLFIDPLDDERNWFRYHHLFRDLLKNRLAREFSSEHTLNLYRKASQWFSGEFDTKEAIKYALEGEDFKAAADLIENTARGTMLNGHIITMLGWIDALPESMLESRPRLNFYRAWALSLGGHPKIAERILITAKSTLDALPDSPENRFLRGELAALLTGIIVYTNDPPRVLREAQEALSFLSKENLISRARVHIAMGTAYAYFDEMAKAVQYYEIARDLALKAQNPFLASAAIEMLAGMQIFHLGDINEASIHLEQVLDLGKMQNGNHQPFTGTAHILLAALNLERNNLDLAGNYLANGIELIEQSGIGYSQTYVYCTKARLHLAQGESENALESLRHANQVTLDNPLMHTMIHNLACQVKITLCLEDMDTASNWLAADSVDRWKFPGKLPAYLDEVLQISDARVYLAQGDLDRTLEILDRIRPQAEAANRIAHLIDIYILKALSYQKRAEVLKAVESLKYAISLAASEGFMRTFLESGNQAWKLLRLVSHHDFNAQFVSALLAAFHESSTQPESLVTSVTQIPSNKLLAEPLSERECEVLKLIAAGYSNQDIANALVVSLNTVKKHTTHIYGKMGVRSRTEAAAHARELGLLTSAN